MGKEGKVGDIAGKRVGEARFGEVGGGDMVVGVALDSRNNKVWVCSWKKEMVEWRW